MIKTIRRILGGTVDAHIAEEHDLLIRCARRCAYDLDHAIGLIRLDKNDYMRPIVQRLEQNQKHWIGLFKGGNSMKAYRHELQNEIYQQDLIINRLYKLLDDAGIIDPSDQRLPF
jgi:hypothetical protein